jgi:hypothetical protein
MRYKLTSDLVFVSRFSVANVPAAAISSIAACRCVIRLQEYYSNTEVFVSNVTYAPNPNGGSGSNAKIVFRPASRSLATMTSKTYPDEPRYHRRACSGGDVQGQTLQTRTSRPEVHVTTEQITAAEYSTGEFSSVGKDIKIEETDRGSSKSSVLA